MEFNQIELSCFVILVMQSSEKLAYEAISILSKSPLFSHELSKEASKQLRDDKLKRVLFSLGVIAKVFAYLEKMSSSS